jgi:hypothetical protein
LSVAAGNGSLAVPWQTANARKALRKPRNDCVASNSEEPERVAQKWGVRMLQQDHHAKTSMEAVRQPLCYVLFGLMLLLLG